MTINTSYGNDLSTSQQKYPALQASCYQPTTLKQEISMCMNQGSLELLSESFQALFSQFPITVNFGDEDEVVYRIPPTVQWVFLGFPKMFMQNKKDKTVILPITRGVKLKENGFVTATRLLIGAVCDGKTIETSEGTPQLFTLKLTSSKTKLLNDVKDPEFRSLQGLNNVLIKHYKLPQQSWIHLVSIGLVAKVETFTDGTDSSKGVMFTLEGKPMALTDEQQKQMYLLTQSDEVKKYMKDPFGITEDPEQPQQQGEYNPYADEDY